MQFACERAFHQGMLNTTIIFDLNLAEKVYSSYELSASTQITKYKNQCAYAMN